MRVPPVVVHTAALSMRSVRGTVRQPQVLVPALFFPAFFMVINNGALNRAQELPGFPETRSYLAFLLAGTAIQGVMFGSTNAASDLALDIQGGFFDRLLAAPTARSAILVGRLASAAVLGGMVTLFFSLAIVPFGGRVESGLAGYAVFVVVGMLLAVTFGALASTMAIRTGSVEAVQGSFPLYFALVFLSSAFFPVHLTEGWFRAVASANPITWLINATRHLIITGWDTVAALSALGLSAGLAAGSVALANRSLRRRLAAR